MSIYKYNTHNTYSSAHKGPIWRLQLCTVIVWMCTTWMVFLFQPVLLRSLWGVGGVNLYTYLATHCVTFPFRVLSTHWACPCMFEQVWAVHRSPHFEPATGICIMQAHTVMIMYTLLQTIYYVVSTNCANRWITQAGSIHISALLAVCHNLMWTEK